ncbi:MAG: glycosyltransferase family 39 protein [Planctomycetota bacterium]
MSKLTELSHPAAMPALTLPSSVGRWLLVGALLLAAGLMANQFVDLEYVSQDAGAFYLPLAREVSDGRSGLHPIIPPVYPTLTGRLALLCGAADDPPALAGRLVSAASLLATVALVYALGSTLYGPRTGAAAAVLTAANPYLVQLGAGVGPDMLYTALLTALALTLVRQIRRPTQGKTALAAALAALAALTRSEGVLLPAIAMVALAFRLWRPAPGRAKRLGGHLLLAAVMIGAVWTPRLVGVYRHTGFAVLDVRMHKYLPGIGLEDVRRFYPPPNRIDDVRVGPAGRIRTPAERFEEAVEMVPMVIGPLTWLMAAAWVLRPRALRVTVPPRPHAHALLAAIVAIQLLAVAPVGFSSRYVGAIAPLVQVWGALGLVTVAETMRRGTGVLSRVGTSMALQWVLVALLAAGLSTWALLKGNNVVREGASADVGVELLEQSGLDSIVLARDSRPSYYGRARWVRLIESDLEGHALTEAALLEVCRSHQLDWIVVETGEQWCPWLLEAAQASALPDPVVALQAKRTFVSQSQRKMRGAYLMDAHALAAWLRQRPDVAGAP